ncbi:hypothetical protein D3C74_320470 [compost metagenome]
MQHEAGDADIFAKVNDLVRHRLRVTNVQRTFQASGGIVAGPAVVAPAAFPSDHVHSRLCRGEELLHRHVIAVANEAMRMGGDRQLRDVMPSLCSGLLVDLDKWGKLSRAPADNR